MSLPHNAMFPLGASLVWMVVPVALFLLPTLLVGKGSLSERAARLLPLLIGLVPVSIGVVAAQAKRSGRLDVAVGFMGMVFVGSLVLYVTLRKNGSFGKLAGSSAQRTKSPALHTAQMALFLTCVLAAVMLFVICAAQYLQSA